MGVKVATAEDVGNLGRRDLPEFFHPRPEFGEPGWPHLRIASACNDDVAAAVGREEDLRDAFLKARPSAGFHLRLFDDLGAVLHLHTRAGALALVGRVAHAQAAEPTGRIGGNRPRSSSQR